MAPEKTLQIFCQYLDKSRFEVFVCGRIGGGVRAAELERFGIPVLIQPPDLTQLIRMSTRSTSAMFIGPVRTSQDHSPRNITGGPRMVETNVFHALDEQEEYRIDCHCFVSEIPNSTYLRRYGQQTGKRYEVLYNPVDFSELSSGDKSFTFTIGRCSRPDDQKWHDVCLTVCRKSFGKCPSRAA